jgi:FkbM family methyltransferase
MCIEPLQDAFKDLQNNRSAICINGCVGNIEGFAEFIAVSGPSQQLSGLKQSYNPLHKNRLENETRILGGGYEVINVPVHTLNNLLDKYTIKEIDFISLDTEGSELEILKAIDFDTVYIHALTVENNYGSQEINLT